MQRRSTFAKPAAFTLIELLVVIAIISILASILFPVFARARESARRASCQSNIKNLVLSVLMYTQDNDGGLVGRITPKADGSGQTTDWNRFTPVQPYIKNFDVLFCPSAPTHLKGSSDSYGTTSAWAPQYGFPANMSNYGSSSPPFIAIPYSGTTAIDSVPNPSQTCLLGETNYSSSTSSLYLNNGYGGTEFGGIGTVTVAWLNRDRHLEGSNFAYMDGHVKWIKKEAIDAVYVKTGSTGINVSEAANFPIVFSWVR